MDAATSVLIVEDEQVLARNLARELERHGIVVDVAVTHAVAMRRLGCSRGRTVRVDVALGEGSGPSIARHLRATSPLTAFIVTSGQDSLEDRERAEGSGTLAFLAKPFALTRFRRLVASSLAENVALDLAAAHRGPKPPHGRGIDVVV